MILPRSNSQRRIGLTIRASRVPFSRSRTTDTAMAVMVVCIRSAPMRPGTMKMAETRSGLYQARTRTSKGTPVRRAGGGGALMADVATCGSEASTITWTSAAWRASRRAKSGGITTPTLALPRSMRRVSSAWLRVQYRVAKYWLFSMASRNWRASTLPDWSNTAVGTCLTSVLMAHPKMKSMATGTARASTSASQSRLRWMNSLAMIPRSREAMLRRPQRAPLLAPPRLALLVHERDEQVLHRGFHVVGPAHLHPLAPQVGRHVRRRRAVLREHHPQSGAHAQHLLDGVPVLQQRGRAPQVNRVHLDDGLPEGLRLDGGGRALGDELPLVDEAQRVAQLGLVHVMRGDDDGRPPIGEVADHGPEGSPRDRVHPGRGLVEEDEARGVHERAGQRQALAGATGQRPRLLALPPSPDGHLDHLFHSL